MNLWRAALAAAMVLRATRAEASSLRLRPPGEGLLDRSPSLRGEVALVTALVGIVLFDGLSETPAWAAVLDIVSDSQALRPTLLWLREQGADMIKLIRTVGLFATVAAFYGAYWLLIVLMRGMAGGGLAAGKLARGFAGSLLPIAVAYQAAIPGWQAIRRKLSGNVGCLPDKAIRPAPGPQ
jgi:hypothetical protein